MYGIKLFSGYSVAHALADSQYSQNWLIENHVVFDEASMYICPICL